LAERAPRLTSQHFKTFGRVVEIRLMSNFGFVEFENVDVSRGCVPAGRAG
jgi:hypothetical protein